jgi:hypothetical protein
MDNYFNQNLIIPLIKEVLHNINNFFTGLFLTEATFEASVEAKSGSM